MDRLKLSLLCCIAFLLTSARMTGAPMEPSYEISKSKICATIGASDAACRRDVELLVRPVSLRPDVVLHWQVQRESEHEAVLKVGCSEHGCVPFLVVVRNLAARSKQVVAFHHPTVAAYKTPPAVRAGDRLTLIRQGDGVRLVTSVVSLSFGHVGDSIPVREYGARRPMKSVVVDAHTVTASY